MQDKELYQHILGLTSSWTVSGVKLEIPAEEIQVRVEHPVGTKFSCLECQKELACYDHAEERRWRHRSSPIGRRCEPTSTTESFLNAPFKDGSPAVTDSRKGVGLERSLTDWSGFTRFILPRFCPVVRAWDRSVRPLIRTIAGSSIGASWSCGT